MTFKIRNFGTDTECLDLPSLQSAIKGYAGKSVSIQDMRPQGRIYFVDVLPSGEVYESYGSRARFDIELRLDKAGGN